MERSYLPVLVLLFVVVCMGIIRTEVKASSHNKYFSSKYQVARERFRNAALEAGASINSFQNPHMGPLGEPLFTDVAVIGSKHATDYLVLGSGTHGAEGFAGSGIQTGLL